MSSKIIRSFTKLREYCEKEDFKGWDPYDGLNSKVFQTLPFLKKSPLMRLAMIQGFKRSPVNFRRVAFVPKEYNTKGIGLFLSGYCNLYKAIEKGVDVCVSKEYCLEKINYLSELLISLQSKGYSGACWGYSFDWQSRAFFLPSGTPTVVATSFAVEALLSAYEISGDKNFLDCALSSQKFIQCDLNRIEKGDNFMFSYSPLDSQAVYNATLLGSKTLSLIYSYTLDTSMLDDIRRSVKAVCDVQNRDGSFPHSDQVGEKWRDSFHTGFKLESLSFYQRYCNDQSYNKNIEAGFSYLKDNYFDASTGVAYYYDRGMKGPIDLHCAAQFMSTLHKLGKIKENIALATNVLNWSVDNMFDFKEGYFYFQKKGRSINKCSYMRWPNAWMFYGMSYFLMSRISEEY